MFKFLTLNIVAGLPVGFAADQLLCRCDKFFAQAIALL